MRNTSEYKEGELAYLSKKTTRDNPYSFQSERYWRWQEGLLGNGESRWNGEKMDELESLRKENEELKKALAASEARCRSLFSQLEIARKQTQRIHYHNQDYLPYPEDDHDG